MARVIAVAAIGLAAGCSLLGTGTGGPVHVTPPAAAPATMTRGACLVVGRSSPDTKSKGQVAVGRHPTGVVIVWLPGMNQHPCRAAISRENADSARRLAEDIDEAPKFPNGNFNCPSDDAMGARMYFTHEGTADLAILGFSGCRGISAPGRSARSFSTRLARDLAPIAPHPWHDHLGL
jgi:hypothetical protein